MIFANIQSALPNPGDEFRYSVTTHFPGSGPETGTEIDTYARATFDGKPCIEKTKQTDLSGIRHKMIHHSWFIATPSGIREIASSIGNLSPRRTPNGDVIHTTFKLGESWSGHYRDKDSSFVTTSKVVRKDTLVVPAGKFACWVIETKSKTVEKGGTSTTKGTEWWSLVLKRPVKSTVFMTMSGEGQGSMASTLISYTLAKRK